MQAPGKPKMSDLGYRTESPAPEEPSPHAPVPARRLGDATGPETANDGNTRPRDDDRRVVLVGASVRAATESARRGGFRVLAVDRFGDVDTLQAAECWLPVDHLRPAFPAPYSWRGARAIFCGGLAGGERHPADGAAVAPLPADIRILGPTADVRDRLRSPRELSRLAIDAGVDFPAYVEPTAGGSRWADMPGENARWLWKDRQGCGGLGVRWANAAEEPGRGGYRQRWVSGRACGATFLGDGRQARLLGVCRSLFVRSGTARSRGAAASPDDAYAPATAADRPFVYAGSFGPVSLPQAIRRPIASLGQLAARRFGLRGLFNADFIVASCPIAGTRVWLLEINPRWSGSSELIEMAWPQAVAELTGAGSPDAADSPPPGTAASADQAVHSLFRLHWQFLVARRHLPRQDASSGGDRADERRADGLPRIAGPPRPEDPPRFWKRIVFATRPGHVRHDRLKPCRDRAGGTDWRLGDIPHDGQFIGRGEPIATLIGESTGVTPRSIRNQIRRVREAVV